MSSISQPTARLVSLDAFRGLAIAAMILVNNPGSWEAVYPPLLHASWHGWTPTDLIFPFFLFIVGMALNFSRRTSGLEAIRRALILFALGLFMAAFPFFELRTVRIPGVLQRIAVCYLVAWAIHRHLKWKGQALVAAGLLVFYYLLLTQVPVPGESGPNLEPERNLTAHLDRLLLGGHLWRQTKTWDPEGLLSTLPAIATTLLGALAGAWLRSNRTGGSTSAGFIAGGIALVASGLAWSLVFPINKNLWTSSYVLFTAGAAAFIFGICYFLADVRGFRAWTRPFAIYGLNAIVVFVASGLLAKTLTLLPMAGPEGSALSAQAVIYRSVFAAWLSPFNASLAYALANVVFWYAVAWFLDRRDIHPKV